MSDTESTHMILGTIASTNDYIMCWRNWYFNYFFPLKNNKLPSWIEILYQAFFPWNCVKMGCNNNFRDGCGRTLCENEKMIGAGDIHFLFDHSFI